MLKEQLQDDLKQAMRARDEVRLRTVRSLRAALMEREIELRSGGVATLSGEQEMAVIQKQAKQRRDAAEQYRDAGRDDLVQKEQEELRVIEDYLPRQMSDEDLTKLVHKVVEEVGAETMRDMGKVMGAAMAGAQGMADGKRVQAAVRAALGG